MAVASACLDVTYLGQEDAVKVDEQLMGPLGFSVDQLMELAGLSVACAVAAESTPSARVLLLAGPGNNGGDGLVAARHLHHFGYSVQICYPKPSKKALFEGLVTQLNSLKLPFVNADDLPTSQLSERYDVILDAMFGFSFHGAPRPPFDKLVNLLTSEVKDCLVASVDIPSGWHVEEGPGENAIKPDMLVSLTTPKKGCRHFQGTHYLGGRFVPPEIAERFGLKLPAYPGTSMCVRIDGGERSAAAAPEAGGRVNVADMRQDESRMTGGIDIASMPGPFEQFDLWMKDASQLGVEEPNAVSLATADTSGKVSNRMVLLKGYSSEGFVFYTNYESRKGRELDTSKNAALCLFWQQLNRQVRVEGRVERLSEEASDEYYHSRPRSSQIGAWCSAQSTVISDRKVLEDRLTELQDQYSDENKQIPRPEFWGGYRVVPSVIEFWHSQPSRLHDRVRFSRGGEREDWKSERLSP